MCIFERFAWNTCRICLLWIRHDVGAVFAKLEGSREEHPSKGHNIPIKDTVKDIAYAPVDNLDRQGTHATLCLMATLARPMFLLAVFALPVAAQAVALTTYSVVPSTIYPSGAGALASTTTITLGFSSRVKVSVKAISASGTSVKTIYSSTGVTNPDPKLWDGTDSSGAVVAPGIYTIQVAATSTATSTDALFDQSKTVTIALAPSLPEPAPDFAPQSYALPIVSGWNLLSLPVTPVADAASTFSDPSIDAVWSYAPDDPDSIGGWLVYDPAHPEISNLAAAIPGEGYFVHANENGLIEGTGTPILAPGETPPSRALTAGWNLVGAFATSSEDIDSAFASLGWAGLDYTALFALTPGSPSFYLPTSISPGDAFWIFLPAAKLYAPSNL